MYLCIDLKSFYASVECVERGLDPMNTNLVVANPTRTEKTICLAVTPALKALGVPGRPRLFEVVAKVREINKKRLLMAPGREFTGSSTAADKLRENPSLELSYIIAPPRMAYYMKYSSMIYDIYLKYVSHEDIHVYSIDEVFMDITQYLKNAKMSAREFAMTIIRDVFKTSGITATAGMGTNMYLAKIAMDIVAKHMPADENGVRIAELDEMSYRKLLWGHRPITDFWRVGKGYSKKLQEKGLYTMGDIARCSLSEYGEKMLYKLFGVNAELLIDHAWGYEPCRISDIKSYKPENNSLGAGQVLHCAYDFEKTKIVVREMIDSLVLELVDKHLVTDQIVLTVGYDIENITNEKIGYKGEVVTDMYGRKIPKHAHGTGNVGRFTSSTTLIMKTAMDLFERIVDENLLVRRINVVANHVRDERNIPEKKSYEQLDLLTDYEIYDAEREKEKEKLSKERRLQEAMIGLKKKFGKNAVLKGNNLQEGATARERNCQIGGHQE